MKYSDSGYALTKSFEECRLIPYKDSGGKPTDGWGNIEGVVMGVDITQEKADSDLIKNMSVAEEAVNRLVKVSLNQNQFDALVDFTFNLGQGNLESSTLLKLVNTSQFLAASYQFVRWDMCAGVVLPGLTRRRIAERDLFLKEI